MTPKHEPPRTCRWRVALLGGSPSAIFSRCLLGVSGRRKACKGCTKNVAEIWQECITKELNKEGKL